MRTHHKFQNIRSFLPQQVRTSASEEFPSPLVRTEQTHLPLTADIFYGRPLMTIRICKYVASQLQECAILNTYFKFSITYSQG